MAADNKALAQMAQKLRRHSIESTTASASGHPTTCMSCAEIVSALFFREMRFDPGNPSAKNTDVFVMSKGHAAPILWAALKEAGGIKEDLLSLRKFDSPLEGHPTPISPWIRVATGSLGQGLSCAAGIAVAKKMDKSDARVYCLMGDGESAEGSVWEAAAFASFNKLDNLCAIVDVNRLAQSDATMYGHDLDVYAKRFEAFGWKAVVIDGHDVAQVLSALDKAKAGKGAPTAIVAKTFKGKGVSWLEDKDGWHGVAVPKDKLQDAIKELGDTGITLKVEPRTVGNPPKEAGPVTITPEYGPDTKIATRQAYGKALAKLAKACPQAVAVDGDVKNSTFSQDFKKVAPERFVEAYIAEQNMVGVALGLGTEGKIPCASTFAAFFSRAYDFIRMAAISRPKNLILCGSHAGVSIGEDGPSQMALEDLAMMRGVVGSTVLYPSDGVSAERCVESAVNKGGIVYIRTTRPKTGILYKAEEKFPVGGSKIVKSSAKDKATIVGAGITLWNALEAHDILAKENIPVRVIDAYSVKPIDAETLRKAAAETGVVIAVEDHSVDGGLGDAVAGALPGVKVVRLGVTQIPRSGKPDELMAWAGIDARSIADAVRKNA